MDSTFELWVSSSCRLVKFIDIMLMIAFHIHKTLMDLLDKC